MIGVVFFQYVWLQAGSRTLEVPYETENNNSNTSYSIADLIHNISSAIIIKPSDVTTKLVATLKLFSHTLMQITLWRILNQLYRQVSN